MIPEGVRLAEARAGYESARADARAAAVELAAAGVSEYQIAERLGVTRRTLRAWLGKGWPSAASRTGA